MNLDQILTRVRNSIRDTAASFVTDADIVRFANDACLDVAARLRLLTDEDTGTTDGTNAFALPADFLEAISLRIATDDFEFVDDDVWWSWSDSADTPDHALARVHGSTIEMYPTPDSGYTWRLRFYRKPVKMQTGESTATVATSSGSAAAFIATINTAAAHGLSVGDIVDVAGVTPTGYNGTWVVASVTDSDTFTANVGTTPTAITVQGTVQRTDVPDLPEEQHIRIVNYCRSQACYISGEFDAGDRWMALYQDGLPPAPTSRARINPGPLSLTYTPGPFDADPEARHI